LQELVTLLRGLVNASCDLPNVAARPDQAPVGDVH
jgi:hypothetical protein